MICTNKTELKYLWSGLGLSEGMVVLCHSFLPSLGKLLPTPQIVVDSIMEHLGETGTFVVPTFTYSSFNGEVYDVNETPSAVGVLGDIVRKYPNAVRSLSPNFSLAAVGGQAEFLMKRETDYNFGKGSIYAKLMETNLYILLIGVDFTSLALFMHLERINNISYRYEKPFYGQIRYDGQLIKITDIHYVRDEKLNPVTHRSRIGALIDQEADCIKVEFGYGEHRFVSAHTVNRVVSQALNEDPFFLVKVPVD